MLFSDGKIFDEFPDVSAQNYGLVRPVYPNKMYDDIKTNIDISPSSNLLEIGSGNGTIIEKFADFGCNVVGIEPEKKLASLAREVTKRYANVAIVEKTFEEYQSEQSVKSSMDVIIALTGFHWIQEEDKYKKVFELLAEKGSFVLIWNSFLQTHSEVTFQIEKLYRKYLPDIYPPHKGNVNERVFRKVELRIKEMLDCTDFFVYSLNRYFSLYHYDKTTYPKFLNTYPKIINTDKSRREVFLNEVGEVISKFGKITLPVMTTLLITQKKKSIINLVSLPSLSIGDQ